MTMKNWELTEEEKEVYTPKEGETIVVTSSKDEQQAEPVNIKTKDFTDISSLDIIVPSQRTILDKEKPYFIPEINHQRFRNNGYTLPAQKIGEDRYLVALDGFTQGSYIHKPSLDVINKNGEFAIMSLDLYAATQKYYQSKAKEENKQKNIQDHQNRIDYFKNRLEEKTKEGADEQELSSLRRTIERAEKSKPKQTRLTVFDKSNKMSSDQLIMLMTLNKDEEGNFVSRREAWKIY